jgi:hypothetical protein
MITTDVEFEAMTPLKQQTKLEEAVECQEVIERQVD